MDRTVAAVDLFCGAGGLSYGLQKSGIKICAGIDIEPACRHPFEANVGAAFYEMDANDLTLKKVRSFFPPNAWRVLAGCAPCQPFSSYAQKTRKNRWDMLSKFAWLAKTLKPDVVTMENVPGLVRHDVFSEYVNTLERAGYHCSYTIADCTAYGIPQTRKRLVLLGSKLGPIHLLPGRARKKPTVRDAIGGLRRVNAGEESVQDRLHKASNLSDTNMKRIKSSVPGGSWKDWNHSLRSNCHSRDSGCTYTSVYGRMQWDEPGPTITTEFHAFGSGRFGHPEQNRALSLREGAMLQTFPKGYSFAPPGNPMSIKAVARLIGNAVPVKLGTAIGRSIVMHLRDYDG